MLPIQEVAAKLDLTADDLIPYGRHKAKIDAAVLERPRKRHGTPRLILVSAITPTPAGEGKTTTTIGLVQAFERLGVSVCAALREPSLGPCFGIKGGGTGGGVSRIEPSTDINLHFNGDLHAVTAAHNLLAAMIDNHIHFRSTPRIEPRKVLWPRVLDVNDRSLRHIVSGLGGATQGMPRETGFDITAASEVMAMLCLSSDQADLRARLARTIVAYDERNKPVTAGDLGAEGAMLALLKDALMPNLVQTTEGTPAIVHGGPFANIAHGCNSVIATRTALKLADWVITEAGFGFDLGAEKFFDIKCAGAGLDTQAVVLVATVRALKYHGGAELADLTNEDPEAVRRGLPNLEKHIESIQAFGEVPVVALNRFGDDTDAEIAVVRARCEAMGVPFAVSDHFASGGAGAVELARTVKAHAEKRPNPFKPIYDWSDPVEEKIRKVARTVYGADGVSFTKDAQRNLRRVASLGLQGLPICIAKTQSSLSDDPRRRNRPEGFEITVREIQINAGAGFLVVLTGDLMRMPGLPKRPQAMDVDLVDGEIVGVQ